MIGCVDMFRKSMLFGWVLLCCVLSAGCESSVSERELQAQHAERKTEEINASEDTGGAEVTAYEPNEFYEKNGKLKMTYNTYITCYSGYLDHVALFGTIYDNCDYDGDGLNDRIFRTVFEADENGDVCGYRVDFGNGEALKTGNFGDYFTGIQLTGFDLTGDGVNEIIFCGPHTACTFPKSMSEIAVFQKMDGGYELLDLPRPDDWDASKDSEKYRTGYSIELKDIAGNAVTICSPKLDYEETAVVDDKAALEYFRQTGAHGVVGSDAWNAAVTVERGIPALVLSVNIGSRYYERDLYVYLIWRDGTLKPEYLGFADEFVSAN
jgi:hypothetical protein